LESGGESVVCVYWRYLLTVFKSMLDTQY